MTEIPAQSRLARKRQDRPVTPEVAGSSPVAPAKNTLQIRVFVVSIGAADRRLLAGRRAGSAREISREPDTKNAANGHILSPV
jgi:hypothetical protein